MNQKKVKRLRKIFKELQKKEGLYENEDLQHKRTGVIANPSRQAWRRFKKLEL